MQHLHKLLQLDNSQLAQILRFGLHGLRGYLQAALKEFPSDPGAGNCQDLLRELDDLLQPAPPSAPPLVSVYHNSKNTEKNPNIIIARQDETVSISDIFQPVTLKLSRLRDAFVSDKKLATYLGKVELKSTTDSDLWDEIQRKLLRVPESLAKSWRERALELAAEAGAREEKSQESLVKLPFHRDEVIYPALTGGVRAEGLCLSANTPMEARVAVDVKEGDIYLLASVVSACLKFIEREPNLHHAFKSVDSFGVRSLDSKSERDKYTGALTDRFRRARAAEGNPDPAVTLRSWLDLDEAVHSLVFLPPVERYSWWGKLQQESRRTLDKVVEKARNAGCDVWLRQLWGPYADVCKFSKNDLELDSGGIPGEVVACLRVYARIGQEELPGRVLFRSLR